MDQEEVFLWSQVCYSPSKFMRWLDQLDREGNKLPVHPGVMLGDVKAKFAFAHGNFVAARPFDQQIRGYMKMLGIGMAQGVDGIGSLMSTIPASFFAKMADRAATDKRVAATHYYAGFGAAAVKQAEGLASLRPRKALAGTFRRPGPKAMTGLSPGLDRLFAG